MLAEKQGSNLTGTSIFDPVLCEVLYNWYSPAGGVVFDPFAGGSVRGITAEMLGRHYIGIDLSERQIDQTGPTATFLTFALHGTVTIAETQTWKSSKDKKKGGGIVAKLTAKQQRFCDEYLIDLNAAQAAIRAGYSPKTAEQTASRLLTIVKVSDEIAREMAERSKRTGINQDRVVQELAKLAFVNIADVVDLDSATVKGTATGEDLACIQSVKIKPSEFGTEREIKLYDKKASLELLGKHLGMFKDKLEVEADMDLNITVEYGDENED